LSLGIGVGSVTAAFALLNHVILRPVAGVHSPESLVTLVLQERRGSSVSTGLLTHADLIELRSLRSFSGLASIDSLRVQVSAGEPGIGETVTAGFVSTGYFEVLGVRTRFGRTFAPEETEQAGHDVVLISESFWRGRFGGNGSVLGEIVRIDGKAFSIIGVVRAFRGWGRTRLHVEDLWLPYPSQVTFLGTSPVPDMRQRTHYTFVGRLAKDASAASAEQEVHSVFRIRHPDRSPNSDSPRPRVFRGLYSPGQEADRAGLLRGFAFVGAGVGLLFLLSCVSTVAVLLAHDLSERRSLATRLALGAASIDLVRILSIRTGFVAIGGGLCGLAVSIALNAGLRGSTLLTGLPALDRVSVDVSVFAMTILIVCVFLGTFGTWSAWKGSRLATGGLTAHGSTGERDGMRVRWILLSLQVAIAFAIVNCAVLLGLSVKQLRRENTGMPLESVFLLKSRGSGVFGRDILTETQTHPGVASAAVSSPAPFEDYGRILQLRPVGSASAPARAIGRTVSEHYFSAAGIELLEGRPFGAHDCWHTTSADPQPVVVNSTLRRQLFGDSAAIGRLIAEGSRGPLVVVGVVNDTKNAELRSAPGALLYRPARAGFSGEALLIRSVLPPTDASELLRGLAARRGLSARVAYVGSLRGLADTFLTTETFLTRLAMLLSAVSLALSIATIVATVQYAVKRRARELGIRVALGGSRPRVAFDIARGAMFACLIGSILGLALLVPSTQALHSLLYGVDVARVWVPSSVALTFLLTAAVAAATPIWQALRVAPRVLLELE
jgi:predicted permease